MPQKSQHQQVLNLLEFAQLQFDGFQWIELLEKALLILSSSDEDDSSDFTSFSASSTSSSGSSISSNSNSASSGSLGPASGSNSDMLIFFFHRKPWILGMLWKQLMMKCYLLAILPPEYIPFMLLRFIFLMSGNFIPPIFSAESFMYPMRSFSTCGQNCEPPYLLWCNPWQFWYRWAGDY